MSQILDHINYRLDNQNNLTGFTETRHLNVCDTPVSIDENNQCLLVCSRRSYHPASFRLENPDIIWFEQITGAKIIFDEIKSYYRDNRPDMPPVDREKYTCNFNVELYINSTWMQLVNFIANTSPVEIIETAHLNTAYDQLQDFTNYLGNLGITVQFSDESTFGINNILKGNIPAALLQPECPPPAPMPEPAPVPEPAPMAGTIPHPGPTPMEYGAAYGMADGMRKPQPRPMADWRQAQPRITEQPHPMVDRRPVQPRMTEQFHPMETHRQAQTRQMEQSRMTEDRRQAQNRQMEQSRMTEDRRPAQNRQMEQSRMTEDRRPAQTHPSGDQGNRMGNQNEMDGMDRRNMHQQPKNSSRPSSGSARPSSDQPAFANNRPAANSTSNRPAANNTSGRQAANNTSNGRRSGSTNNGRK